MDIKDFNILYNEYIDTDLAISEDYTNRINKHFMAYLKNPTEQQEETFKSLRDALIIAFLADLLKKWSKQSKKSINIGYDTSKTQLDKKNIKKILDKNITTDKILELYKPKVEQALVDLTVNMEQVKANSDRIINNIKTNLTESSKSLGLEMIEDLQDYGITYFTDTAGRRQDINNYIKKKSLALILDCARAGLFYDAIRKGVDTVKIIHLNIHPHCPLCEPFTNAILSISGKTEGLMTIDEAYSLGLWHFYCDDVPIAYELAPEDEPKEIKLNENNKARKRYMDSKGYKLNL